MVKKKDTVLRCEQEDCHFECLYPSQLKKHLGCAKHKNGGERKVRKDKVHDPNCSYCSYSTTNLTSMKVHYLTKHATKEERAEKFRHYCEMCDFGTMADVLFDRHLETKKHLKAAAVAN